MWILYASFYCICIQTFFRTIGVKYHNRLCVAHNQWPGPFDYEDYFCLGIALAAVKGLPLY